MADITPKYGIDISRWQGNFNFARAIAEGVEFAILKGGGGDDGLYVDGKFARSYAQAKQHSLPVGVYWFSHALTVAEAEAEAAYFYTNVLSGRTFELPVYIDVEHGDQLRLSRAELTDVVCAWCDYLEQRGHWVGIYSTPGVFASEMDDSRLQRYAHWCAYWGTSCPYEGAPGVMGMWQFGGETNLLRSNKVAGVTCDQNYMYIDYPALIKAAGRNGFNPTMQISVGSVVRLRRGATDYNGGALAWYVYLRNHTVTGLTGDRAVISYNGIVVAAVRLEDLVLQ